MTTQILMFTFPDLDIHVQQRLMNGCHTHFLTAQFYGCLPIVFNGTYYNESMYSCTHRVGLRALAPTRECQLTIASPFPNEIHISNHYPLIMFLLHIKSSCCSTLITFELLSSGLSFPKQCH